MMRCANKFPRRVYFMKADDTPLVWRTISNEQVVTWNTARMALVAKITKPLQVVVTPRQWALLAHNESPEDGWLVEQGEATEACWMR